MHSKIEEIFVFDDASQDRTYEAGRSLMQEPCGHKLQIFRNPVNLMYGGNQRKGYQYAIGRGLDIVVLLHGDGQYAPEVMQDLLTPLENGTADMVMGSRMMIHGAALRGQHADVQICRQQDPHVDGEHAGRLETHANFIRDTARIPCMRCKQIPLDSMTWNWHFDTQIILEFLQKGFRIKEVPIPTYYGDEICHVNGIPYALNCIRETFKYAAQERWRRPLPARRDETNPMPHYRLHRDPRSSHQQISSSFSR